MSEQIVCSDINFLCGNYTYKKGVVYTEIMLPANAPPEYADRETLWNAAEEVEKQWNSQLARRFVLTLPREIPNELYPQMVRDYCQEHFVSKGMCCDFAIHDPDPPGHNPHCHVMLTMRAMDEHGKWLPKPLSDHRLCLSAVRISTNLCAQPYASPYNHGAEGQGSEMPLPVPLSFPQELPFSLPEYRQSSHADCR